MPDIPPTENNQLITLPDTCEDSNLKEKLINSNIMSKTIQTTQVLSKLTDLREKLLSTKTTQVLSEKIDFNDKIKTTQDLIKTPDLSENLQLTKIPQNELNEKDLSDKVTQKSKNELKDDEEIKLKRLKIYRQNTKLQLKQKIEELLNVLIKQFDETKLNIESNSLIVPFERRQLPIKLNFKKIHQRLNAQKQQKLNKTLEIKKQRIHKQQKNNKEQEKQKNIDFSEIDSNDDDGEIEQMVRKEWSKKRAKLLNNKDDIKNKQKRKINTVEQQQQNKRKKFTKKSTNKLIAINDENAKQIIKNNCLFLIRNLRQQPSISTVHKNRRKNFNITGKLIFLITFREKLLVNVNISLY